MTDHNATTVTALLWAHRLLQFGSNNGAAGGVFIGSPDGSSGSNGNNDNPSNSNPDDSSEVDFLAAFVLILGGIACVLVIVMCTYVLSVVMDNYCCCCPGFVAVGSLEETDQGVVAKRAGLWGLLLSERQEILRHLFADKQIVYHAKQVVDVAAAAVVNEDVPTPVKDEGEGEGDSNETDIEQGAVSTPPKDDAKDDNDDENPKSEKKNANAKDEPEDDSMDDADHERVCCICLAEYEEGRALMTGMSCIHKFHYDCSMDWLLRHDQCPYCRKCLVPPKDFREAAIQVLGPERVKYLSHSGRETVVVAAAAITATTSAVASTQTTAENEQDSDLEAGEQPVEIEMKGIVKPAEALKDDKEDESSVTATPKEDATSESDLEASDDDEGDDSKTTAKEAAVASD
jgi:hypothetical protein